MKFTKLEEFMSSRGITSLADIARALNTSPQAVSNWKARDQVPYHVIAKLNKSSNNLSGSYAEPQIYSSAYNGEKTISFSDILLNISEQLKVIIMSTFIAVFFTFTYIKFIEKPLYSSSATFLLAEKKPGLSGGMAGLASQFGVNIPQSIETDLSSPSLFPEILHSRKFAERIFEKYFYTLEYGKELSLLAILTYGDLPP
ncbi:uncharacterized protein METZ01_LOCUS482807, partial [marine metagenome]